jgi:hypothetical protein
MTHNDPVEVHTTASAAEAEIVKNLLKAEGIRCEVDNSMQAGLAGVLPISIKVRPEDAGRAKELIETHGKTAGVQASDQ